MTLSFGSLVRLGYSHIRVYLPPMDGSAPSTYCSRPVECQPPLLFNELFRIPVPAGSAALTLLQLYVCSLGPQLQEELLVGALSLGAVSTASPASTPLTSSWPCFASSSRAMDTLGSLVGCCLQKERCLPLNEMSSTNPALMGASPHIPHFPRSKAGLTIQPMTHPKTTHPKS